MVPADGCCRHYTAVLALWFIVVVVVVVTVRPLFPVWSMPVLPIRAIGVRFSVVGHRLRAQRGYKIGIIIPRILVVSCSLSLFSYFHFASPLACAPAGVGRGLSMALTM